MLAAAVGLPAVPLPAPVDHGGSGNPALHLDNQAGPPAAARGNAVDIDNDDHGPIFVPAADDVRVIILVELPAPILVRAIDAWLHETDHAAPDRLSVAPAVTMPAAGLDRLIAGTADSATTAPIHLGAATGDVPRIGNVAAPLNLTQLAATTLNVPLPALDPSAFTAHVLANVDLPRTAGANPFAVGVPGPADVSVADAAYAPVDSARSSAMPAAVPWLAGLLTPVVQFDSSESLMIIEHVVGAAQGWGRALASKVAALIASPWLAGVAVAVATVELCRRRARRAPRVEEEAVEVPTITGPSQLI